MKFLQTVLLLVLPISPVIGFSPSSWKKSPSVKNDSMETATQEGPSRRDFFRESISSIALPLLVAELGTSTMKPLVANADGGQKVLVLGGSGFVGSRVVKNLKDQGVDVLATSTNGRDGTIAFDATKAGIDVAKEIESLSKGCTAVISCIGSIGTPNDGVINAATGLAARGAKAAGVERFVYISVAPEVKEFAKGIDFLEEYMKGKTFSMDSVESVFPNSSHVFIEP